MVGPILLPYPTLFRSEIAEIGHVALDAGDVSSDLLDRRRQLGVTADRKELRLDFIHELLCYVDTPVTNPPGDEANLAFELPQVDLLLLYTWAKPPFAS